MPIQLHADHIAAQGGGYEPQRTNHWSIRITGLAQPNVLELSLATFSPPKRSVDNITIAYGNEERKVAGRATYSDCSLTINDYVDASTWQTMWNWQELVHNTSTGAIGFASGYKKAALVFLYAPDGTRERRWRCQGIWPTEISPSDLDQAGNEQMQLTCSMMCDKIIPEQLQAA